MLTVFISLLKASEVLFSVMEKIFDQVTIQMEAATVYRTWHLEVACVMPEVPSAWL